MELGTIIIVGFLILLFSLCYYGSQASFRDAKKYSEEIAEQKRKWKPSHQKKEYPLQLHDAPWVETYHDQCRDLFSYEEFQEVFTVCYNTKLENENYGKKDAIDYFEWWIDEKTKELSFDQYPHFIVTLSYICGMLTNKSFSFEHAVFTEDECKVFREKQISKLKEHMGHKD